jgi:alkanesulfonate monooxygenase SsuD/methylene tetrahydromethanopterin reductase-like flavin-dependent oxidoreductase (luciferase family)
VRDWERVTHPLQERVPILLAAAGPKALDLAGTVCDGVIFNILTSDAFLREAIPQVRAAASAAGRDPDALAFVLRTTVTVVTNSAAERRALERGKTLLALVATLPGMGRLVETPEFDVPGLLREVRRVMRTEETLRAGGGFPALRRGGDLKAARGLIADELIRRLGIVGPLPVVRERIRALEEIGVTHVGVAAPEDATSPQAWRKLLVELRG